MVHPIKTETGSAIEKKTDGTGNLQGKIANNSETAFVTKRVQKAKEHRKETVKNRTKT